MARELSLTLSTATLFVFGTVLSEVLKFLWPFLAAAGFDAVRAVIDDVGCDGVQQRIIPQWKRHAVVERWEELVQRLHRPFEADVVRTDTGPERGFRHHLSNQIVRQQVRVEFVANAVRCFAAEVVHLHHDLETSQIEFGMPALSI